MSRKGFTLIEILTIIAIAAILISLAVPTYIRYQQKSKVSSYAEPYARACLMDLITFCIDHPQYLIDSTILGNLTNCKKLIGFNVGVPDKPIYAVFAAYTSQSDVIENIHWKIVTSGSTVTGVTTTTYSETYSIYVDNLTCNTKGQLVDNNGNAVDITTRLVYNNNNKTTQVGPYFAECSYYPGEGLKCIITDNPKNN